MAKQRQQTGDRQRQQGRAQLRIGGAAQGDGQHDRGDGDDQSRLRVRQRGEMHVMLLDRSQQLIDARARLHVRETLVRHGAEV
jgi:hypothetical protein